MHMKFGMKVHYKHTQKFYMKTFYVTNYKNGDDGKVWVCITTTLS
jgi:hypothetical protein